jgi:hypothetical protein
VSWPQILAPLYAAVGVVIVTYGWRWASHGLEHQIEALSPTHRVAAMWIFSVVLFTLWPVFFLIELYRYMTAERS